MSPQNVDAFVFWSKDFIRFTDVLSQIDDIYEGRFIFHYTITGLNKIFEPVTKSNGIEEKIIENFFYLNDKYPGQVLWRFDPIIYTNFLGHDYYLQRFQELSTKLNHPKRCFISFVNEYNKISKTLNQLHYIAPADEEKLALARDMVQSAPGTQIYACCNPVLLEVQGIQKAACIDREMVLRLFGRETSKKSPTRAGCGCSSSADIGNYGTCRNKCVYCYAK